MILEDGLSGFPERSRRCALQRFLQRFSFLSCSTFALSRGCERQGWIRSPAQKGVKSLIPLTGNMKNLRESALVFGRGSLTRPPLVFPKKVRLCPPAGDSLLLGRAESPGAADLAGLRATLCKAPGGLVSHLGS